ncbi:type II secretion system F family protein [Amantichitinum ursilacus]|uniref:Type II secretion system protein F n=1 Tax=Amantichitinum ursilacus TaxID=857265 RepID=A0A0N0XMT3_9NEIS|nr:type II secretion system F family protein [Amantichitinum ursilacus]KPC55344.1 Type II secretion system protein F [Amantichitinum ursilacus]
MSENSLMRFKVRWISTLTASIEEREREAVSAQSLREQIVNEGGQVLSLAVLKQPRASAASPGKRFDVGAWCREMATLVRAGMTVVEAIETLQLQAGAGGLGQVQQAVLNRLQQGRSLSQAMDDSKAFPQVLIASVIASERTGRLVEALDDFIQYEQQLRQLRKQTLSAAIYPLMVIGIGGGIVLFLLFYVLPRFAGVYDTFQGDVSAMTRLMLGLSKLVTTHLPMVILGLVGLTMAVAYAASSGRWQTAALALARAVPISRRALDDFNKSKLYQALALTLKGGYPLMDALTVCETLGFGAAMTADLTQAKAAIARGQSASVAFGDSKLADPVGVRLLRVGERTGQFVLVLQALADRHADAFSTFIQRATLLIEPILLLLVALIVGSIVVMMYMPIFDIASGIH